jgi:hypothetical protein
MFFLYKYLVDIGDISVHSLSELKTNQFVLKKRSAAMSDSRVGKVAADLWNFQI